MMASKEVTQEATPPLLGHSIHTVVEGDWDWEYVVLPEDPSVRVIRHYGPEFGQVVLDFRNGKRADAKLPAHLVYKPPIKLQVDNLSIVENSFIDDCKSGHLTAVIEHVKHHSSPSEEILSHSLTLALEFDHVTTAEYLLQLGAKVRPETAFKTRSLDGFQVLADSGWDISARSSWFPCLEHGQRGAGGTWRKIISSNNLSLISRYLTHGKDTTIAPDEALGIAAERSIPAAIDIFLDYGLSVKRYCVLQRVVRFSAPDLGNLDEKKKSHPDYVGRTTEERLAMMEHLIKNGADVNKRYWRDPRIVTPLHAACKMGRVEEAKCLLKHGADTCIQSSFGWVPLDATLYTRDPERKKQLHNLFRDWEKGVVASSTVPSPDTKE